MSTPWGSGTLPLDPKVCAEVRQRAIFDCCKWDPQVEDVNTLSNVPIVLARDEWTELRASAEALAAELQAAEAELAERPDLHGELGLSRAVRRAVHPGRPLSRGIARLVRFDFHHTERGWRISEGNSDVPGGMNEASGLGIRVAPHYPGTHAAGDPAGAYVEAFEARLEKGALIALVHATAYTDDRQVMTYLAERFEGAGWRTALISPAHLQWRSGVARVSSSWLCDDVSAIVRFFPAEWLPNLPAACVPSAFFRGALTPVSNPASAVLTQSKRFPLVWDRLLTRLETWRRLLPETRDPRDAMWEGTEDWVLKPALGRVGEDIAMPGVTPPSVAAASAKDARRHPDRWVAQRRFTCTPMCVGDRALYPCIGIYTIDGRVAGAYGRLADRPLIDALARDAAVLVEGDPAVVPGREPFVGVQR